MENKIFKILSDMSEELNYQQLEKLQQVLLTRLSDETEIEEKVLDNNDYLELFVSAKRVEGCTERTIEYYRVTIEKMLEEINIPVRRITTEILREYLTAYQMKNNCSKVTIDNVRRNLSSFFSWLEDEDHIIKSPIRRIHKVKTGTPTMGGVVFILVPFVVLLILAPKAYLDPHLQIVMLAYLGYGLIGFVDDFIIVVQKNNQGLPAKMKFLMQSILAIIMYLLYLRIDTTEILIPVLNLSLDLGHLYFVLIFLMFTAESNAVNLTDGIDGLSSGCVLIALAPFVLFAIMSDMTYLALFLLAVMGGLLGYLRFNFHPAKIFMGDTGSLALGGLLAACAMVLKREILLVIIGVIFVVETLSVVIQVTSFKLTKKRVFKMAPLHHHFELCGYKEVQVVLMFWGVELIFAILGFILGVL